MRNRKIVRSLNSKIDNNFYNSFTKLLGPRHRRCGSPIVITLSVRLSVRPHFRCNAITRKVFDLETSYTDGG